MGVKPKGAGLPGQVRAGVANILRGRFFYGWKIVAVVLLGDIMWGGITYLINVFAKPMTAEMGWSRTAIYGALALRNVVGALAGPAVGPLVDRYGARYLMVLGALFGGLGTIALGRVNSLWQFYLIFSVFTGVALYAMGSFVTAAVIAKWFIRLRGRATAIAGMGMSFGGVLLVPLSQFVISNYDWRTAWVVIGIMLWLVVIPPAFLFMRRRPEDMGLSPDGVSQAEATAGGRATRVKVEESWTLKEALRSPALWLIVAGFNAAGLGQGTVLFHQGPYMTDQGLAPAVMAWVVTIFALCMMLSKLFWGVLSERIHVRWCCVGSFLGGALGTVVLLNATTTLTFFLFAVTFGLGVGSMAILMALVYADYFGRDFVGTIRGVVMPLQVLSIAGGPLFAAYIYDTTGSYQIPFSLTLGCYLLGAFLMFMAKPGRRPSSSVGRALPLHEG